MKKVKFLALAMVFAIMLMGVGYAAWTDKITINTTVATGEFDVDFTGDLDVVIDNEDDHYDLDSFVVNNTQPVSVNAYTDNGDGTDKIFIDIANLYPGASFTVDAEFENRGTIPAILESVIATGVNEDFLNLLQVKIDYDDGDSNGAVLKPVYSGPVSGLNDITWPDLELGIDPLNINDYDRIILKFEFPFDTPEGAGEGYFENTYNSFSIDLNWVQFNSPNPELN